MSETTPKANPDQLAQARAAFDKIRVTMPGGADEPVSAEAPQEEPSEPPPRLSAKAPKAARAPKAKREEPAEEPETSTEDKAERPAPTVSSAEVERARANLLLARISPKAVKALDDEEALHQWALLQEERRTRDEAMQERAELRKRLAALEAKEETEPKPEPTVLPDITSELAPLYEELGVDPSSKAGSALKSVLERMTGPLVEKLTKLEASLQETSQAATARLLKAQRARLGVQNPRLKESEAAWRALAGVAETMAQDPSAYADVDELFDAAYREVYGEAPSSPSGAADDVARKAASSPSAPRRRQSQRDLSAQEKAWHTFRHIRNHPEKTREEIKAYAARLGQ